MGLGVIRGRDTYKKMGLGVIVNALTAAVLTCYERNENIGPILYSIGSGQEYPNYNFRTLSVNYTTLTTYLCLEDDFPFRLFHGRGRGPQKQDGAARASV